MTTPHDYIRRFSDPGIADIPAVGGKNASLGEMFRQLQGQGLRVSDGFAVTAPEERARLCLDDGAVLELAEAALRIEDHYSAAAGHPVPMDIEWARDGIDGKLYMVQARPETVASRRPSPPPGSTNTGSTGRRRSWPRDAPSAARWLPAGRGSSRMPPSWARSSPGRY